MGQRKKIRTLTENQVLEIRRLHKETGATYNKLAEMFGVSPYHVGAIVRFEAWKELESPASK